MFVAIGKSFKNIVIPPESVIIKLEDFKNLFAHLLGWKEDNNIAGISMQKWKEYIDGRFPEPKKPQERRSTQETPRRDTKAKDPAERAGSHRSTRSGQKQKKKKRGFWAAFFSCFGKKKQTEGS